MTRSQIAVIGSGPAAISAVLWLERFGHSPLWFGDSELGGTLHKVFNPILDIPPQTYENGAELASSLASFAKTLATQPLGKRATGVTLEPELTIVDGTDSWPVAAVIVATGTAYRTLNLLNEVELEGKVLFRSCARFKNAFPGKDVLVVGGGDAAFEGAALLQSGGAHPVISVRKTPRARTSFLSHVAQANIPVLTHSYVTALEPDPSGCMVTLNVAGELEKRLFAAVFVRIGVTPNTPELPEIARDYEGYLVVDSGMQTSISGIFAAGDVRSTSLRSVVTAMGDGALAATSAHASMTSKTC